MFVKLRIPLQSGLGGMLRCALCSSTMRISRIEHLCLRAGTVTCSPDLKLESMCCGWACGMLSALSSPVTCHGMQAAQQAQWEFMDAMLTAESDMFCDVNKLRRAGFHSQVRPSAGLDKGGT